MKGITNLIIYEYNLYELGVDFMGYRLQNEILTYHHLIKPRRLGGQETLFNGAVLIDTSHNYLHVIERYNLELFNLITSEIIDEKITGIDKEHIERIDSLLSLFELEHKKTYTKKNKLLIKDEYINKRYMRSERK